MLDLEVLVTEVGGVETLLACVAIGSLEGAGNGLEGVVVGGFVEVAEE